MRDFLPSLAIGLRPKPLSGRGHVPSANLQDFRPPNERANVCGRSSEDCSQTADPRLILSYWFYGFASEPLAWRIRAFGSYGFYALPPSAAIRPRPREFILAKTNGLRKNERRSAPPLTPKAQEAVMFPPEQVSRLRIAWKSVKRFRRRVLTTSRAEVERD